MKILGDKNRTKGLAVDVWLVCSRNSEKVNVLVEEQANQTVVRKKIKDQIK